MEQVWTCIDARGVLLEEAHEIYRRSLEKFLLCMDEMMSRFHNSELNIRVVEFVVPKCIKTSHDVMEMLFREAWEQVIDGQAKELVADTLRRVGLIKAVVPTRRSRRSRRRLKRQKRLLQET